MQLQAILMCLLAGACAAAAPRGDVLDRYAEEQMRLRHLPGLALAVVRPDGTVERRAWGTADLELAAPATPETVFEIGSLTKQFSAAAVLLLAEEGKLDLDSTLADWWPEAPDPWRRITLRHALRHTSGLRNHVAVPGYLSMFKRDLLGGSEPAPEEAVRRFFELPQEFEPGASWAYDNTGYWLLGRVIERASGQDYWDFLEQRILAPLGMEHTGPTSAAPLIAGRADGYEWVGDGYENRPALPPEVGFAAGSLRSTVGDLARWDAALRSGALLSPESRAQLWSAAPNSDGSTPPYDYGYGWFVGSLGPHRFVQHSGGTPGFSAVIYRFPELRLTVIALSNVGDRMLDAVALDVAALCESALRPPAAPVDPDPARSARIRGAVAELLAGQRTEERFTPSMNLFLRSATGTGFWQWHASHGALGEFAYSSERSEQGDVVVRFRVTLGDAHHYLSARLEPDGRISQLCWW